MASVRVEGLVKRYAGVDALKAVSVEIPDGSLTAILGPSGCGKTTLLRCIAGLLLPDEGQVFIGETDVTRAEPFRRNLGMVFQRPSMFPHMTVYQNIAWALALRKWPKARVADRVREMLRLVQLDGMEGRSYNQLSGGQAQRVVIARALAPQPDLLLLDEPLSALDAKLRGELLGEIAAIQHETKCTTLLVTHDQAEALTVADNLLLMNQGEIVQQGAPLEVYRHPANVFSASFIGTTTLLPCTVKASGAQVTLQIEGTDTLLVAEAPPEGVRVGQSVYGCVRADDVDVLPEGAGGTLGNIVIVKVVRAVLTGGIVIVDGLLASDHALRVHVGGSQRFALLNGETREIRCALGSVTVIARE